MQFELYFRENKGPGNILNNGGYDQLKRMSSILKHLKVLGLCLRLYFQFPFLITTYPITMDNLTWYHLMYKYSVNIPKYLSYKAA